MEFNQLLLFPKTFCLNINLEIILEDYTLTYDQRDFGRENTSKTVSIIKEISKNQEKSSSYKSIKIECEFTNLIDEASWLFILSLLKEIRSFKGKNLKLGFFLQTKDDKLNDWNKSMRNKTLSILKESLLSDWDILINIQTSSSIVINDILVRQFVKAFQEIKKELFRLDKLFIVWCSNEPFETDLITGVYESLHHLNKELKSLGLFFFNPVSKHQKYTHLLEVVSNLKLLEELMIILPYMKNEDFGLWKKCLDAREGSSAIKSLRIFMIWKEMDLEGI